MKSIIEFINEQLKTNSFINEHVNHLYNKFSDCMKDYYKSIDDFCGMYEYSVIIDDQDDFLHDILIDEPFGFNEREIRQIDTSDFKNEAIEIVANLYNIDINKAEEKLMKALEDWMEKN